MENREALNNKIAKENPDMKFIVRLYDGFDFEWVNCTQPIPLSDARTEWLKETENGTKRTEYANIDYYDIFPEDTRMLYSYKDSQSIMKTIDAKTQDKGLWSYSLQQGKYTIIQNLDAGVFKCLRYDEEWRDLIGDNLILALCQRIQDLESELKRQTLYP